MIYFAGRLGGRATSPWREQAELRLKARVARLNRLWAAVFPEAAESPPLELLEKDAFGGWLAPSGPGERGAGPSLWSRLVLSFLAPAVNELTGGWPRRAAILLAIGVGEDGEAARERAWAALAAKEVGPVKLASGEPETDAALTSLWALTEAVAGSWTARQRRLYQLYCQHGRRVSQVAEAGGMSPSATSHMLHRMHVREVEEGRKAFFVLLARLLEDRFARPRQS